MIDTNTRALPIAIASLLLAGLAGSGVLAKPAADPGYSIVSRWTIGGPGGWDYLTIDSPRHRLFISRGDHVDVLDVETGKVIGRIADTQGVHGIALAPDRKRGYTSNGRANSITEFEYGSLAVLRTVPVPGQNPDAILYERLGNHLFTFNGSSRDATVFDATTLAVVAQITMPGKPEFAREDGRGHVYVNIETVPGQLVRIDSKWLAIDATWPLPGCARPTGLALDRTHARLFSVCDAQVMAVTDANTGTQVAQVTIGAGPDAAAFDAGHGLVFSSNGEGTLTVVQQDSPDRYHVAATLATQRGARTMAFDDVSRRVYLVTAEFGAAPAAAPEQPNPRPTQVPDTFTVLVAQPR